MRCGYKLLINVNGDILHCEKRDIQRATAWERSGSRIFLVCPICSGHVPAIWWDNKKYKGACNTDEVVVEIDRSEVDLAEQSKEIVSLAAVGHEEIDV